MKTAGVVLDFYDDPTGSLVKEAFPTPEVLPESVKTAHILSTEERQVLRDEAYALILHNDGSVLRKFACVDEGNTLLSCLYFEENAAFLPEEAVKVAAANLASFCEDFGLEPTPFVKMAAEMKKDHSENAKSGMGKTRDPMMQPMVGDEADWSARTNLVSIRGGGDSGRVIPTANQMKTAGLMDVAKGTQLRSGVHQIRQAATALKEGARNGRAVHDAFKSGAKDVLKGGAKTVGLYGGAAGAAYGAKKLYDHTKTANAMPGMPGGTTPAPSTSPAPASPMMGKKPVGGGTAPMVMPKMAGKTIQVKDPKVNLDSFHKLNPEADPRRGALTDDKRNIGVNQKNPPQQNHQKQVDKNTFAVGPGKGDLEVNYKKVANKVDVTGEEPRSYVAKMAASRYAMDNKYPLDSFADVQKAVEYFDENWVQMDPAGRHEYCVKTAARADELGIHVSDLMERYGSQSYSADVEAHLSARKANSEKEFHELFDTLKEKRSSIDPLVFAELLTDADRAAGLSWYWGGNISDPYLATFGPSVEKLASCDWTWQSRVGDRVTAEQLHKLARNGKGMLKKHFDHHFIDGFMKDPIPVFESMPDDSKTIIARLADDFDGIQTN